MKKKNRAPRTAKFWPTVGLATLAGMRSMSAPALLTHHLSKRPSWFLLNSPLQLLQKPWLATGMKLVAASEMVADKMPGMPDRIAPPVLLGRLVSGALVGATWYKSRKGSALAGGVIGGLGAVAATFLSFALRKGISEKTGADIAAVGVGEDALVLSSGAALLKAVR